MCYGKSSATGITFHRQQEFKLSRAALGVLEVCVCVCVCVEGIGGTIQSLLPFLSAAVLAFISQSKVEFKQINGFIESRPRSSMEVPNFPQI